MLKTIFGSPRAGRDEQKPGGWAWLMHNFICPPATNSKNIDFWQSCIFNSKPHMYNLHSFLATDFFMTRKEQQIHFTWAELIKVTFWMLEWAFTSQVALGKLDPLLYASVFSSAIGRYWGYRPLLWEWQTDTSQFGHSQLLGSFG